MMDLNTAFDMQKPHKGKIHRWYKVTGTNKGLGYRIAGEHEGGNWIFTSPVILHLRSFESPVQEIETLNSRYTLAGYDL